MEKNQASYTDRVLEYLKGGDRNKVERLRKKTLSHISDQITIRKKEIADNTEKLIDLEEQIDEAILAVDVNAIKTIEDTIQYAPVYTKKIARKLDEIANINTCIDKLNAEIAKLEEIQSRLK